MLDGLLLAFLGVGRMGGRGGRALWGGIFFSCSCVVVFVFVNVEKMVWFIWRMMWE